MKASLVVALGAGVAILAFGLFLRYRRDLNAARPRLAAVERHVISTKWGAVEYVSLESGGHLMLGQTKIVREELADFFVERTDRRAQRVAS